MVNNNTEKLSNLAKSHPNQSDVKCTRIRGKPLNKYIDKLLTTHNLDIEYAPSFYSTRKHAEFKYMVSQKDSGTMRKNIEQK